MNTILGKEIGTRGTEEEGLGEEDIGGKDLVIKLDPEYRIISEAIRDEANSKGDYDKKISFKDIFIYLLTEHGKSSIDALVKLRVQAKDKVGMKYRKSETLKEYDEWLLEKLERLEELESKGRRNKKRSLGKPPPSRFLTFYRANDHERKPSFLTITEVMMK